MATTDVYSGNKALVEREIQAVWTDDDLDVIDELYAPDVQVGTYRMGDAEKLATRDDIKRLHREWDEGFPDATFVVNEMTAEDDAVIVWWTMRATHTGTFRGFEASGNPIEIDGFSFRRFADGNVIEVKDTASMMTLLDQIGVPIPKP